MIIPAIVCGLGTGFWLYIAHQASIADDSTVGEIVFDMIWCVIFLYLFIMLYRII